MPAGAVVVAGASVSILDPVFSGSSTPEADVRVGFGSPGNTLLAWRGSAHRRHAHPRHVLSGNAFDLVLPRLSPASGRAPTSSSGRAMVVFSQDSAWRFPAPQGGGAGALLRMRCCTGR
jgi:hypothetical protein